MRPKQPTPEGGAYGRTTSVDLAIGSRDPSQRAGRAPIRATLRKRALRAHAREKMCGEKFADSSLEGTGFEPLVRGRGEAACRVRRVSSRRSDPAKRADRKSLHLIEASAEGG